MLIKVKTYSLASQLVAKPKLKENEKNISGNDVMWEKGHEVLQLRVPHREQGFKKSKSASDDLRYC